MTAKTLRELQSFDTQFPGTGPADGALEFGLGYVYRLWEEDPATKQLIREEVIQIISSAGGILRGWNKTTPSHWPENTNIELMAKPMEQPDSRTGLGYLNPHECPVCGEMHFP